MHRFTKLATGVAAVFALVIGTTGFAAADVTGPQGAPIPASKAAAAAASTCKRQSAANTYGQEIALTNAEPRTYTGTAWQAVDCGSTSFKLKPGQRALVTADVNAEFDCNGTTTSSQWCEARALLSGVEGAPVAAEPSSFAIDSVAGGVSNWQAHAMNRSWEVRCGNTAAQGPCTYKFAVQTKNHDSAISGLWIDELAVHLRVTIGAAAAL